MTARALPAAVAVVVVLLGVVWLSRMHAAATGRWVW